MSRFSLLLLAVSTCLGGCHHQQRAAFTIDCSILPEPVHVGEAPSVRIALADSLKHRIADARISLEADMSHPGMKPLFASAASDASGAYEARMNFDMPGDWTLVIHAELPGGQRVDGERNFTVSEK